MPFIGAIIAAIARAASTVAAVASTVGAAVSSTVGAIATTVAGVSATVVDSVTSAASATISALGGGASDLFGFLNNAIKDAGKVETAVITPISKYVDEVTSFVNNINDNLVKPITDSVLTTYTAVSDLIGELHTDIHGGIKGILSIPDALAGALTTVDAQLGRAMQELGLANKEVVTAQLLPGMQTIIGDHLSSIAGTLAATAKTPVSLIDEIGQVHLSGCLGESTATAKIASVRAMVEKEEGWVGELGKILLTVFWVFPYLVQSVENDIGCFKQSVNEKNPIGLLDLGTIVKAQYRGILSHSDAATEAAKQGLSGERLKVLLENDLWLPGPEYALRLLYRGLITQAQFVAVLEKQALTAEDIAAVQGAFLEPVDPREIIGFAARKQALDANFLPAAGAQPPPAEAVAAYAPRFTDPARAKWDWLAHWKIPELEWWFTAWARGMRTQEEFRLAAQTANIPPDVIDDMIPVFQEPIQLWMIPDMLGAGIFTDQEALAYLHYIGMDDASSQYIMRFGVSKKKAGGAAQAAELAGLTAGVAKTMFADGIITAAQYEEVLLAHAFSAEATALMVKLAQHEQDLAARKTFIADTINAVNAGAMSETDAVAAMYSYGLTQAEVDAAQLRMKGARIAKTQIPSKAELDELRKAGVIGYATWADGLSLMGWSDMWIQIWDCFGGTKSEWTPDPNTACGSLAGTS